MKDKNYPLVIKSFFSEDSLPQKSNPKCVIITGGIGSGKTTLRKQKFNIGFLVLDANEIFLKLPTDPDEVYEDYALVKGGNDLLDNDTRKCMVAVRSSEYGFEGLTSDMNAAKKLLGDKVVYDKATLEDIMFFNNLKVKNEQ